MIRLCPSMSLISFQRMSTNLDRPIIASPCTLLTRRTGNPNPDPADPTAPWSYYVAKRAVEVLDETLDETLDEMLGDTQEDAED
jgi:hypothetical protein